MRLTSTASSSTSGAPPCGVAAAAAALGAMRAYALLLDGDDAARHYTDAAVAHAPCCGGIASDAGADIVLLLNRDAENAALAPRRGSRPLVDRAGRASPHELAYDRSRTSSSSSTSTKLRALVASTEYGKLVFIDLDVVLRGSQARLFAWPGRAGQRSSPTPRIPYHFNSGIAVVEPDNHTYARHSSTRWRSGRYRGGWDYTDQALSRRRPPLRLWPAAASPPAPRSASLYTHAAHWHRRLRRLRALDRREAVGVSEARRPRRSSFGDWYAYMRDNGCPDTKFQNQIM
jgi:hypothetical protein